MDEFDANTAPFDEPNSEEHHEGSSRRTFLKAAVVGSAAAVAVSGVGAATLTLTGRHTGLKKFVTLGATISGATISGHACTTNTSDSLVEQTTFNNQESIYFWALFKNVPAGQYTLDITPTIGGASTIVEYQASNNVNVHEYTGGSTTFDCNPPTLSGMPAASATADSLTVTINTSASKDILLEVHLQGKNGNPGGDVTLTAKLYQGPDNSGTLEASAPATFHINPKP